MEIKFITKTGKNGLSIIDRDKSFMNLIDNFESEYPDILDHESKLYIDIMNVLNDNNFNNFLDYLVQNTKDTIDENERVSHEDVISTLISMVVFKLIDVESRDVKLAIEMLADIEKIHPCADIFLLLGFLYYCAPNGMIQNKPLALSYLRQVDNPKNIFLDDADDTKEWMKSAIALISASEPSAVNSLVKTDITVNDSNGASTEKSPLTIKDTDEKKSGIWKVVINVALKALSNFSADKLNDPIFMRKTLGKTHGLLPFWIRMVVSEDVFFNFCFDRRALLINKVSSGQLSITNDEGNYYLPKDDEQPQISKETMLVNIVERHSGNLFSEEKFYFFPNIGSEKFMNAYNSYAKEALERVGISNSGGGMLNNVLKSVGLVKDGMPDGVGVPLFMYDLTAFGSCKTGFIITTEMFIVKEVMKKPTMIKISHIDKFELKKSFLSGGKIYINNQCIIDCNQGTKESFQKFSAMFNEILDSY